jgi:hypothetical protein
MLCFGKYGYSKCPFWQSVVVTDIFLVFLGTDDGDLKFDYLSNFGPRFRKLADMYGEDPSDDDDENFNTPASESWC